MSLLVLLHSSVGGNGVFRYMPVHGPHISCASPYPSWWGNQWRCIEVRARSLQRLWGWRSSWIPYLSSETTSRSVAPARLLPTTLPSSSCLLPVEQWCVRWMPSGCSYRSGSRSCLGRPPTAVAGLRFMACLLVGRPDTGSLYWCSNGFLHVSPTQRLTRETDLFDVGHCCSDRCHGGDLLRLDCSRQLVLLQRTEQMNRAIGGGQPFDDFSPGLVVRMSKLVAFDLHFEEIFSLRGVTSL